LDVSPSRNYFTGLFELHMDDDRYLPFEGAGMDSVWRLELNPDNNAFDIADVDPMLHFAYTAHEGGDALADASRAVSSGAPSIRGAISESLHERFASQWLELINQPAEGEDQSMSFTLNQSLLPYLHRRRNVSINTIVLLLENASTPMTAEITAPNDVSTLVDLTPRTELNDRVVGSSEGAFAAGAPLGDWRIKLRRTSALDFRSLTASDLTGLTVVVVYDATNP